MPHSAITARGDTGSLDVDLEAVRRNFRKLANLAKGTACASVVKADAYGLGSDAVAGALAREGCRTFFVATLAEGRRLRISLGPECTIHVLEGVTAEGLDTFAAFGLSPVLNSEVQIGLWSSLAGSRSDVKPAAIHMDTGMNRLGLDYEASAHILNASTAFKCDLLISHLSCADDADSAHNRVQLARMQQLSQAFPGMRISLANSSGIFLGDAYHFDLVRPGAALYGLNPVPGRANPMEACVRLRVRVLQTRHVRVGDHVGYGTAFRSEKPLRAAVIALGYADGWSRSRGLSIVQDGVTYASIGNMSMDSTILDISAAPLDAFAEGAFVEILGDAVDADAMAALQHTIGYEILCKVGSRYPRHYR